MSGALMNYDFGPKRHFRRWIWNRIEERTKKPREAIVIYLPGEKDFDRAEALRRGFISNNLIGVEKNKRALRSLREREALTAHGDFFSALCGMVDKDREIGVVYGDLCTGYQPDYAAILSQIMLAPAFHESVFAFNLQRGHDRAGKILGEFFEPYYSSAPIDIRMHRGAQLLLGIATATVLHATCHECGIDFFSADASDFPVLPIPTMISGINALLNSLKPAFHSYHSESGNEFDSVVFKNNWPSCNEFESKEMVDKSRNNIIKKYPEAEKKFDKIGAEAKATQRSLAAIFAHRTMRTKSED